MAHYFGDRRKIRDTFWVVMKSGREKIECTIFERWAFEKSEVCYCGVEGTIKVSKSRGISQTTSTTIESTIEGSIGPLGLAQLKSAIKTSLGCEVNWRKAESEEASFPCKPPKCGRSETTIYQLIRDYELAGYSRGFLFRKNVWDRKWAYIVPEETGSYAGVPDFVEWDERCKCSPRASPDFDGRLSVDLGTLSLLLPYQLTPDGIKIRISNLVVSFPFFKHSAAVGALEHGLNITVERSFLPPALVFLGSLAGMTFEADARIYRDAGTKSSETAEPRLVAHPSIEDIRLLLKESREDELVIP